MDITAFIRILQLSQQLGLGAVLIEQPPGPAAAPVPAVCQLDLQAVLPLLQQGGYKEIRGRDCGVSGIFLPELLCEGVQENTWGDSGEISEGVAH